MASKKYDFLQRIQVFKFVGIKIKIKNIGQITSFLRNTLYHLKKNTIQRVYDLPILLVLYNVYIENIQKMKDQFQFRKTIKSC